MEGLSDTDVGTLTRASDWPGQGCFVSYPVAVLQVQMNVGGLCPQSVGICLAVSLGGHGQHCSLCSFLSGVAGHFLLLCGGKPPPFSPRSLAVPLRHMSHCVHHVQHVKFYFTQDGQWV